MTQHKSAGGGHGLGQQDKRILKLKSNVRQCVFFIDNDILTVFLTLTQWSCVHKVQQTMRNYTSTVHPIVSSRAAPLVGDMPTADRASEFNITGC